jgi:phosphoesterase RecJ-like protein
MISAESIKLFRALIDGARRLIITTHINPDGDAIGSEFALARWLVELDKSVGVINDHPTPANLAFLEDARRAEAYEPQRHDAALRDADLLILVDNSAPDRLGRMEARLVGSAERVLCIDHHPARDAPWRHGIVDVGACATTAMIYELMRASAWQPDRATAEALYVGLATDTGFFRFNSTSVRAHEIAAELLARGVEPARTYEAVYERNSAAYTRLLGHGLAELALENDGAVASVRLSLERIRSLQAQDVDTSEMTTPLLAIDGVRIAVLYRELGDGRIKVSLRSKGDLDVHGLAARFGGGGHRNASGIVMRGSMDEVVQTVRACTSTLLAGSPDPRGRET